MAVADEIGGLEFASFVKAATSGNQHVAQATLDYYNIWSGASRANPNLLVHEEAMAYEPSSESVPQFDAMAVMLILELLEMQKGNHTCGDAGRIFLQEFEAVHFFENVDDGLETFPGSPRSAFSIYAGTVEDLPDECPGLTEFVFDPNDTPEEEYPIMVALGFVSPEAKKAVYRDMASRLAGDTTLCKNEVDSFIAHATIDDADGSSSLIVSVGLASSVSAAFLLLVSP